MLSNLFSNIRPNEKQIFRTYIAKVTLLLCLVLTISLNGISQTSDTLEVTTQSSYDDLSVDELFEVGNAFYEKEDFKSAFEVYSIIETKDYYAPELYLNMGNASYKLDDIPNAIYYFEKGLKFSPGSEDLKHNLDLASKKTLDKSTERQASGMVYWLSDLLGGTADFWAKIAVGLVILAFGLFIARLFVTNIQFVKWSLNIGSLTLVIGLMALVFSFMQGAVQNDQSAGINFEPTIEIKNEPSINSSTAFVLHEGSKLQILDQNKDWYKVSFGKEKVGWMQKSSLKVI